MPNKCSDSNCSNCNTRKYSDSNTTTQRIWMLDYFNVMIMCGGQPTVVKIGSIARPNTSGAPHISSTNQSSNDAQKRHKFYITVPPIDRKTDRLTKKLTAILRESARRRPSACLAIPVFYRSAGLSETHWTTTGLALTLASVPPRLKTTCTNSGPLLRRQKAFIRGHNFTWKTFWDSNLDWSCLWLRLAPKFRHSREAAMPAKIAGCAPSLRVKHWHSFVSRVEPLVV